MKKMVLLLGALFLMVSCKSILVNHALKKIDAFDDKAKLAIIKKPGKEIVFVKMHHLGKHSFYKDVKRVVDSLQKKDYRVLYEGLPPYEGLDSITIDKDDRKFRKLTGIYLTTYYDTINRKLFGKYEYKGKHILTNQPKVAKMGVDTIKAINADISMHELITQFEKVHREIILDSCDYKISLEDPEFNCRRVSPDRSKYFKPDFIIGYRNKKLIEFIDNANSNKILILYGSGHLKDLVSQLQQKDAEWQLVKG